MVTLPSAVTTLVSLRPNWRDWKEASRSCERRPRMRPRNGKDETLSTSARCMR